MWIRLLAFVLVLVHGLAARAADPPELESPEVIATRLDALANAYRKARTELPATNPVRSLAASLGRDPDRILAWVREQTRPSPYRGLLRGAAGVIEDRRGSALDRAVLLAALLREANLQLRLVRGDLTWEQAQIVATAMRRPVADPGAEPDPAALVAAIRAEPALKGMPEEAFSVPTPRDLWERLRRDADEIMPPLRAVLGPDAGSADAAPDPAILDHWWVEALVDGTWRPFDPVAGLGPVAAKASVAPNAVPAEEVHRLRFTLVAETHDRADPAPVLEWTSDAAALEGRAVTLRITPLGDRQPPSAATPEQTAAGLDAWLAGTRAWQASVIGLGGRAEPRLFTDRGEVAPATEAEFSARGLRRPQGPGAVVGSAVSALAGALSAGPGPAAVAASAPGPVATLRAVRLRIALETPGRDRREHVRTLYAAAGPAGDAALDPAEALRRARSLLADVDVSVWSATPTPATIAARGMATLENLARGTAALLKGEQGRSWNRGYPITVDAFARLRLEPEDGADVTAAQVVLTWTRASEPGASVFDVVANEVAAPSPHESREARFRQGVRDTVAEAIVTDAASGNAALAFLRDRRAGKAWTTVADPSAIGPLGLDDGISVLFRDALARGGRIAFGHDSDSRVLWWRHDPATGAVLGMDALGRGASTVEYINTVGRIVQMSICSYTMLGNATAASAAAIAGDLAGQQSATRGALTAGACIIGGGFSTAAGLAGFKGLAAAGTYVGLGSAVISAAAVKWP